MLNFSGKRKSEAMVSAKAVKNLSHELFITVKHVAVIATKREMTTYVAGWACIVVNSAEFRTLI